MGQVTKNGVEEGPWAWLPAPLCAFGSSVLKGSVVFATIVNGIK